MEERDYYRLKSSLDRSPIRRQIMELLADRDNAVRPTEIADELGVARNNISTRLGDLRDNGLVEVLNPEDNRNRYYRLTDAGHELLQRVHQHEAEYES